MKDTSRPTNMEPVGQNTYFRNLVRRYEQRNNNLAEREAELRQRVDLLQSTLPAILVWNLWRTRQDEPLSLVDVARAISNPYVQPPERGRGTAPSSLPSYRTQSATDRRPREIGEKKRPETSPCENDGTVDPSRNVQFDVRGAPENQLPSSSETGGGEGAAKRIQELEAERQRLIAEKEEAEARWRATEAELRAKLQELEGNREPQSLESAKVAEEEYRERIRELEEELRILKEQSQEPTITMVYGAIQYPIGAEIEIGREDMCLGERPSSESLRSCDIESMKQLQQLVENELNIKRRITELEQREAYIYNSLQSTDVLMGNVQESIGEEGRPRTEPEQQLGFRIPSDQKIVPAEIITSTEIIPTQEYSLPRKIEPLTATSSRASGAAPAEYARAKDDAPTPTAECTPATDGAPPPTAEYAPATDGAPTPTAGLIKVCPPCEPPCEPCGAVDEIEVEITKPIEEKESARAPFEQKEYTFDPSNANETALHSRIQELEQVISDLHKELAESDKNMQKLQKEVDELQKNLDQKGGDIKMLQQGYEKETGFLKSQLTEAEDDFKFASCECDAMKEEKIALVSQIQDLIGEKEELDKTIELLNKSLAAKDEELRLAIEAAQQGVPFVPPERPEVIVEPREPAPAAAGEPPAEVSPPPSAPPPPTSSERKISHIELTHITTCDTEFEEEFGEAPPAQVSKPPETVPTPSAPPAEESPAPCEPPPAEESPPCEPPPAEESPPCEPPPAEESPPCEGPPCDTEIEEAPAEEVSPEITTTPDEAPSVDMPEQPPTTDSEAPRMLAGVVLAAVRDQDIENVGREVDAIVAHTKECQICSAAVDEAINTLYNQILGLLELIAQGHLDEPIEGLEFPRIPQQKEPAAAEEPEPPPAGEEAAPCEEPVEEETVSVAEFVDEEAPTEDQEVCGDGPIEPIEVVTVEMEEEFESEAEEEAAPAEEEEAAPAEEEEAAPAEEEEAAPAEEEAAPAEEEAAPAEEEAAPAEEEAAPAGEEAAPAEEPVEVPAEEEAAPAEEPVEVPAEEPEAPSADVTFKEPDKPLDAGVPGACEPVCWRDPETKPSFESRSITSDPSCSILCWAERPPDEEWYVPYLARGALRGSRVWKKLEDEGLL